MLKRFYSKRSGFTLVEIIIAFAVFAIMASMIMQILQLSVEARHDNLEFQNYLDTQERLLTIIEKNGDDFDGSGGDSLSLKFSNGTTIDIPYSNASVLDSDFGDMSYLVGNFNYDVLTGEGGDFGDYGDIGGSDPEADGSNTGSQMSRVDTRITGTSGIGNIQIHYVIKDTYDYVANGHPELAVPAGRTRYFIYCAASSGSPETLLGEDVPFSQYRLFFYHEADPDNPSDKSYLDTADSSIVYTDDTGRKYTKEVHKEANILQLEENVYVKYINNFDANRLKTQGLVGSDLSSTFVKNNEKNKYTVERLNSNTIRIGPEFKIGNTVDGGMNGQGVRFQEGKMSAFYIEFEGDPHITEKSFGGNAESGALATSAKYERCPMYNEYDADGNPVYSNPDDLDRFVNIYGAFLSKRNYID